MKVDEKLCPQCAETIKKAAHICKHCGYRFSEEEMAATRKAEGLDQNWKAGCALVVIVLIALLAFCTPDSDGSGTTEDAEASSNEATDGPLDRTAQHNAVMMSRDGVRARLRDPDSAEFRNVGYYSGGGTIGVCGEVNAKNGFGGYTGYERFIASGEDVAFLESDMDAGEFQKAWRQICVKSATDEVQLP